LRKKEQVKANRVRKVTGNSKEGKNLGVKGRVRGRKIKRFENAAQAGGEEKKETTKNERMRRCQIWTKEN